MEFHDSTAPLCLGPRPQRVPWGQAYTGLWGVSDTPEACPGTNSLQFPLPLCIYEGGEGPALCSLSPQEPIEGLFGCGDLDTHIGPVEGSSRVVVRIKPQPLHCHEGFREVGNSGGECLRILSWLPFRRSQDPAALVLRGSMVQRPVGLHPNLAFLGKRCPNPTLTRLGFFAPAVQAGAKNPARRVAGELPRSCYPRLGPSQG